MSNTLAIGIEPTEVSDDLAAAFAVAGFQRVAPHGSSDPIWNETVHEAEAQAPGLVWFVAARDGRADLDRSYSFAALAEDRELEALLQRITHATGLRRVAVWIYDLSDRRADRVAEQPLSRLVEALTGAYWAGGPVRSAYHEFVGTRSPSPPQPTW